MKTSDVNPECYPILHYTELLEGLIQYPVTSNIIRISPLHGEGDIRVLMIEDNFCIVFYKFSLKQDLLFTWFRNRSEDDPYYKLIFNIGKNPCFDTPIANEYIEMSMDENVTILYSTDFAKDTFIPKDRHINRVGMLFTKSWLENNFLEASDKLFDIVNILVTKNKPTYIAEQMQPKYYRLVNELTNEIAKDRFALIHIKVKAMLLLNDFLDKIVNRDAEDMKANQSAYYREIAQVENKLQEYYDKPMPNIAALAKAANMSPATLKRHFKIVYGKSVYTYYLEKKLAIGRALITSHSKSISETAYSLGYNKINSFSKAFKKYYGVLPKDIHNLNRDD